MTVASISSLTPRVLLEELLNVYVFRHDLPVDFLPRRNVSRLRHQVDRLYSIPLELPQKK